LQIISTRIPDVKIIETEVFGDHRGVFVRYWDAEVWERAGIGPFVQDNVSVSAPGVLRGLHFQRIAPQGKLLSVHTGSIFDVAVDIRPDSSTYGEWVGVELRAGDHTQLWVPPGFAHGFCVLEGPATVHYRCTTMYRPDDQGGIRWDDPGLAIEWPIVDPVLSNRDREHPFR
jgi:dTDP-4-dehydrorhamnose 3,5-epimerase